MKISKYTTLAKRGGYCAVFHVADTGIFLGTKSAIYKAQEFPEITGEEQIRTVLDIDRKQAEKVYFSEFFADSADDVVGLDLRDGFLGNQEVEKLNVAACTRGKYASALKADDGELIFYDETLLSPLKDRITDSDYIKLAVRESKSGKRYVVCLDGIELLAAIMPLDIVSKEFLEELKEFEGYCYDQWNREQLRKLKKAELRELKKAEMQEAEEDAG